MSGYNINQDVTISGTLTIKGADSTIRSTSIKIADQNLELGFVDAPSDTTANGGGITIKGTTDKTISWDLANSNWTLSDNLNIPTGKVIKIGNVEVLSEASAGKARRFFFAQL